MSGEYNANEGDAYLGMILFASSASAGQRFDIWAVSNCVRAGSRRNVLRLIKWHERYDKTYSKASLTHEQRWPNQWYWISRMFSHNRVFCCILCLVGQWIVPKKSKVTYAVSGASLSRFSNKYFTSEMSKQPALLNSISMVIIESHKKYVFTHLVQASIRQRLLLQ